MLSGLGKTNPHNFGSIGVKEMEHLKMKAGEPDIKKERFIGWVPLPNQTLNMTPEELAEDL